MSIGALRGAVVGLILSLAASTGCAPHEPPRPTTAPVVVGEGRPPSPAPGTASATTWTAAVPAMTSTPVPLTVANTGKEGAILRREPGGDYVRVLPGRMRVADLGEERSEAGRVWRRVRTPEGQEGWVAAELLALPGSATVAAKPTTAVSAVQTALAATRTTAPAVPARTTAPPTRDAGPPLDLIPTATLRPPPAPESGPRATPAVAPPSPRALPAPGAADVPAHPTVFAPRPVR